MHNKTKVNMFMRSQNGVREEAVSGSVSEKYTDRIGSGTVLYPL